MKWGASDYDTHVYAMNQARRHITGSDWITPKANESPTGTRKVSMGTGNVFGAESNVVTGAPVPSRITPIWKERF